jgi:hypothetical protein
MCLRTIIKFEYQEVIAAGASRLLQPLSSRVHQSGSENPESCGLLRSISASALIGSSKLSTNKTSASAPTRRKVPVPVHCNRYK